MTPRLTETEARVLRLAVAGFRAEEIAHALDLSREAVAWHLAQSSRKLGICSTPAAAPPASPSQ